MSGNSDKATAEGGYVDQALDALGGEDADFMVAADVVAGNVALRLSCRAGGCEWGYTIGQIEVWELVTDARAHFEDTHVPPLAAEVQAVDAQGGEQT